MKRVQTPWIYLFCKRSWITIPSRFQAQKGPYGRLLPVFLGGKPAMRSKFSPNWNDFSFMISLVSLVMMILLLMEEILHHLRCIKPCKWLDKLPTSTGWPDFFHQQLHPGTAKDYSCLKITSWLLFYPEIFFSRSAPGWFQLEKISEISVVPQALDFCFSSVVFPKTSRNKRGKIRVPQILAAFSGFPTFPWICSISAFDENHGKKSKSTEINKNTSKGCHHFWTQSPQLRGFKEKHDSPKKTNSQFAPVKCFLGRLRSFSFLGFNPCSGGKQLVFRKRTY